MEEIDRKLRKENIHINYKNIQHLSFKLICLSCVQISTMFISTFIVFRSDVVQLIGIYIPMYISAFPKIWFVIIILNMRQKFDAINGFFEEFCEQLKSRKDTSQNDNLAFDANLRLETARLTVRANETHEISIISSQFGYLDKEIMQKKLGNGLIKINMHNKKRTTPMLVKPFSIDEPQIKKSDSQTYSFQDLLRANTGLIVINDKFDNKLINLCSIHDEICEISKIANHMFSFQMLALMAYGFIYITAYLYFVYCGLVGQVLFIIHLA